MDYISYLLQTLPYIIECGDNKQQEDIVKL